MNKKIAKQGQKVDVESCPKCNDELIVKMNDGTTEVFECKNCKFQVKRRK